MHKFVSYGAVALVAAVAGGAVYGHVIRPCPEASYPKCYKESLANFNKAAGPEFDADISVTDLTSNITLTSNILCDIPLKAQLIFDNAAHGMPVSLDFAETQSVDFTLSNGKTTLTLSPENVERIKHMPEGNYRLKILYSYKEGPHTTFLEDAFGLTSKQNPIVDKQILLETGLDPYTYGDHLENFAQAITIAETTGINEESLERITSLLGPVKKVEGTLKTQYIFPRDHRLIEIDNQTGDVISTNRFYFE